MRARFFYFPTPTGGNCDGPLAPVEFNDCNPEILLSEIRRIFVAPANAENFTDWTDEAEWLARLSDVSVSGNDYIRTLVVRGNKAAPAGVDKLLTNNRRLKITKNHTLSFIIDEANETNHEFVRQVEAGPSRMKIWYETHGGVMFGGNSGILVDMSLDMVLGEGEEEIQTYNGTATWKNKFTEERTTSPIFDIGSTGQAATYDTTLEFTADNSDTAAGITATIPAISTDVLFEFDAINPAPGTPVTMSINLNGIEVMTVDFPDDYIGFQFRYTDEAEETHTGVFVNGNANF